MTRRVVKLGEVHRTMDEAGLDLLLVNSPANVWYFSGYPLALSGLQGRGYGRNASVLVPRGLEPVLVPGRFEEQISRARAWAAEIEPFEDYVQIPVVAAAEVARRRGFPMSRIGIEREHLSTRFATALAKAVPESELVPADRMLDRIRAVKQDAEIEGIASTHAAVCSAVRSALVDLAPGMLESDMHNRVTMAIVRGLWSEKVDGCVLAGERIHLWGGQSIPVRIRPGDWLRLDYTCAQGGFPTRFCRMATAGQPSAEQLQRYAEYTDAVQTSLKTIRPGVTGRDVWQASNQALASRGLAPTGGAVGFSLGYGPMERPFLSESESEVLRKGMVFSIEPRTRDGIQASWVAVFDDEGPNVMADSLPPYELVRAM